MLFLEEKKINPLLEDERPILLIRKHWLIHTLPVVFGGFVIILSLVFVLFLVSYFSRFFNPFLLSLVIIGESIFVLVFALFVFIQWFNNYFDITVITNRRLIDIDQEGVFRRKFSELSLDKIQDITVKVEGILQTYLDFGNILIQTAAEYPNFVLSLVPHPYNLSQKIIELHQNFSNLKKEKENGL